MLYVYTEIVQKNSKLLENDSVEFTEGDTGWKELLLN